MEVVESHPFRVTRDAEMAIQELEADDLLETIEQGVRRRRFGSVVRVTVDATMPDHMRDILVENLEMDPSDVYAVRPAARHERALRRSARSTGPTSRTRRSCIRPLVARQGSRRRDLFAAIRERDILLHHPYDSFEPGGRVPARRRPTTRTCWPSSMTLYRVGRNSPVVEALMDAAANGKEVAVLVELKARFDEESNIELGQARWSARACTSSTAWSGSRRTARSRWWCAARATHPPLRPPRHRQLQRRHRPALHRPRLLHLRRGDRRRRHRPVQLPDRLFGGRPSTASCWSRPVNLRQRIEELIEREIDHAEGRPRRRTSSSR